MIFREKCYLKGPYCSGSYCSVAVNRYRLRYIGGVSTVPVLILVPVIPLMSAANHYTMHGIVLAERWVSLRSHHKVEEGENKPSTQGEKIQLNW